MRNEFKRKRWMPTAALLVVGALAVGSASVTAEESEGEVTPETAPPRAPDAAIDETTERWFVELSSPPSVEGTSPDVLKKEKDAFRAAAARAGVAVRERMAFDRLWNGLSVEVARRDLARVARIDGVKAIYPVATISVPQTASSSPDLATALAMTGADAAQQELGLSGAGVRVAIMDTGVDYDHADLGGCFGPGCRVQVGWDFVGDAFNADSTSPSYNPTPTADPFPDDCNGHGTHVAGIVGASGATTGVAPGVTFGAYRVFGCEGSTTADIMIAAMERALADGMDVLNMSIGSAFQWPQYPTAQASDRLVNKGMVVVASIGNSGANGVYSAGAPGLGAKVIGVASYDNSHVSLRAFRISPDGERIGYGPATGAPAPPTSGDRLLARTGTRSTTNDACSPLPAGSLAGKVALIRRGTCSFHTKSLNAQNAGAVGVVLYNNGPGRFSATVAGSPAITVPVVSVSDAEGVLIDSRIAAGPTTMTWTDELLSAPNPTGGHISSFSSFGLSPDLVLKPDLGGPGGLIRAPYPLEKGGYATLSGTSMSSPHVAGAVALLLEARPNTPSQAVRDILQNTARPRPWSGIPNGPFIDNVHRQGAGMVDIPAAVNASLRVTPAKLSLGESEGGAVTRTLTIENASGSPVTLGLSHLPALATGRNTFSPSYFNSPADVTLSAATVVVPAHGNATVTVTIAPRATLADRSQYGGYLVLTPTDGGRAVTVPFAGFKGDYQSIPVLTAGLPDLARWNGSALVPAGSEATFTMQGSDVAFVRVHLDHQVRLLRIVVKDAATGRSWHRAVDRAYLGRNSTPSAFFTFAFDGETTAGNKTLVVPDGRYVLELSVLKALGDESNPAHWETWTSPAFVIDRP